MNKLIKKTKKIFNINNIKLIIFNDKWILGKELYTKSTISNAFPELRQFIYRQSSSDLNVMNKYKNLFIEELEKVTIVTNGNLLLFYANPKDINNISQLENQSQGMVVDFQKRTTELLTFSYELSNKLITDWPADKFEQEK